MVRVTDFPCEGVRSVKMLWVTVFLAVFGLLVKTIILILDFINFLLLRCGLYSYVEQYCKKFDKVHLL